MLRQLCACLYTHRNTPKGACAGKLLAPSAWRKSADVCWMLVPSAAWQLSKTLWAAAAVLVSSLTAFDWNRHLVAVACQPNTSAAHHAQAPEGSEVAGSHTAQLSGHL